MSLLKKLFGGGNGAAPSAKAEPVLHEGFSITPTPMKDGSSYRLSAVIEKQIGDELKTETIIRADTFPNADQASEAAITKAKLLIDQMGDKLFR